MPALRFFSFMSLVLLTGSIGFMTSCSKKNNSRPSPGYTGKMTGERVWHRHFVSRQYDPSKQVYFGYDYFLPDTSFALNIINDTVVSFLGREYTYNRKEVSDSVFYFDDLSNPYYYQNGRRVTYFVLKDSICFIDIFTTHNGSSSDEYFTD